MSQPNHILGQLAWCKAADKCTRPPVCWLGARLAGSAKLKNIYLFGHWSSTGLFSSRPVLLLAQDWKVAKTVLRLGQTRGIEFGVCQCCWCTTVLLAQFLHQSTPTASRHLQEANLWDAAPGVWLFGPCSGSSIPQTSGEAGMMAHCRVHWWTTEFTSILCEWLFIWVSASDEYDSSMQMI